jgi:hypothetical protein
MGHQVPAFPADLLNSFGGQAALRRVASRTPNPAPSTITRSGASRRNWSRRRSTLIKSSETMTSVAGVARVRGGRTGGRPRRVASAGARWRVRDSGTPSTLWRSVPLGAAGRADEAHLVAEQSADVIERSRVRDAGQDDLRSVVRDDRGRPVAPIGGGAQAPTPSRAARRQEQE